GAAIDRLTSDRAGGSLLRCRIRFRVRIELIRSRSVGGGPAMFALSGRRDRRRTVYRFVVATVVLGILGAASASKSWSAGNALSPELCDLCRAGSNAYYLKSTPCSLHADTPVLERLSHSDDRTIRELATDRLLSEKLLGDFDQAARN